MKNQDFYEHDVVTVKRYGKYIQKVTYLSSCRISGLEDDRVQADIQADKEHSSKGSVNDEKLVSNIARARSKVKEYVLCNPWDFWCTFTLSPKKYDRYNLKGFVSGFHDFVHSYNRRCSPEDKVRYLLVPEMHKDGAWHMHGFLKGIRESDLYVNQNGYLSWRQYEQKFGFMSMARIVGDRGIEKLCSYAMKYMSKEIGSSVTALGSHLYYCSKGLQTAQLIYKGRADLHCDWDWIHPDGFCKVKTFDDREDADISEFLEVLS